MVALDGLFSSFWKQEVPGEGADEEGAGPVGSCLGEGVVPSYQGVGVSSLEVVADLQHFSKISILFPNIFIGFKVCNNDQGRTQQHLSVFFSRTVHWGRRTSHSVGWSPARGWPHTRRGRGHTHPWNTGGWRHLWTCKIHYYHHYIYIYTFFNYQVMKSNKRLVLLSSITKRENLKFPFAFWPSLQLKFL